MSEILQKLGQHRIVPVIAINDAAKAKPLAEALTAGGLPVAEVTFRTAAAPAAIKAMASIPGMIVGAGTVLSVDQVKQAIDCGATYMVAPGFDPAVVSYCVEQGIPITPGIATPTDLTQAVNHGLEVVKFFPAEALGGMKLLKALAAPFGQMRFIPTGGIGPDNMATYLAFAKVLAVGGSWMVKAEAIDHDQWDQITAATAQAVETVARIG